MQSSVLVVRKLSDLKPVLLEKNISIEKDRVVYYVFRGYGGELPEEPEWKPDITVLTHEKIGQEYSKTLGHYHQAGEKGTYLVLQGSATLLIQKPKQDNFAEIEDFQILKGKTGEKLYAPEGYGHCLINLADELLVVADWEPEHVKHNYEPIKNLKGMAYYMIEENGKPKLVKNENYKSVPEIEFQ